MKSVLVKTCPGSRIEFHHDSSNCVRCLRTQFFYNEFHSALEDFKQLSENVKICGIITFLDACFKYEVISDDEKIENLSGKSSKLDYFSGSILTDPREPVSYYSLLGSILRTKLKKDSKIHITNCSSSVCALNYKYRAKPKEYHANIELENVFKEHHCTGKKSRTVKPSKSKTEDSDKIPTKGSLKRKRWYLNKLTKDGDHEDDVFEEETFYRLRKLDEIQFLPSSCFQLPEKDKISSSSSDYSGVGTPTWCFALSPNRRSPTPEYTDCYDLTELRLTRKDAEVYQHRRKKRKPKCSKSKNPESTPDEEKTPLPAEGEAPAPAEVKTSPSDVKAEDLSQPSCSYQIVNPLKDEEDYDSDEVVDVYFSDPEEEENNSKQKFC